MGEASGANHPRSADLFVALVAVALRDSPVIAKELGGTFPRPAHAEVEDDRSARPAVLELIGLVVAAPGLIALHADGGLVGLDVSAFEQVVLQDGGHGEQQFACGHDGRIQRAARKIDPVVSVQIGRLPVKGQMGEVFLYEHIDNHRVGELALLHDLWASGGCRDNSTLRTFVAGQFLALDHAHEVAGRFDLEDFLFLVANAAALLRAAHAEPLLAFHGNDLLAPRQMSGQGVTPGMLALCEALAPRRDLRFLLDFLRLDSGLEFQELDLLLAELLAFGPILLEPLKPEHFPQQAILLFEAVGILRPLRECLDERSRFLRQTLKIDAGNRFQRHLLRSCLAISNKHDT